MKQYNWMLEYEYDPNAETEDDGEMVIDLEEEEDDDNKSIFEGLPI